MIVKVFCEEIKELREVVLNISLKQYDYLKENNNLPKKIMILDCLIPKGYKKEDCPYITGKKLPQKCLIETNLVLTEVSK